MEVNQFRKSQPHHPLDFFRWGLELETTIFLLNSIASLILENLFCTSDCVVDVKDSVINESSVVNELPSW